MGPASCACSGAKPLGHAFDDDVGYDDGYKLLTLRNSDVQCELRRELVEQQYRLCLPYAGQRVCELRSWRGNDEACDGRRIVHNNDAVYLGCVAGLDRSFSLADFPIKAWTFMSRQCSIF